MPAAERAARSRLFGALEEAFPVRIVGRQPGDLAGLDAVVFLGLDAVSERERAGHGRPCLIALRPERFPAADRPANVDLTAERGVDERLRGRRLRDIPARFARPLAACSGDRVLAGCRGAPVWLRTAQHPAPRDIAALAPQELDDGEALRERLVPGRFLALLPLVELLRRITSDLAFSSPPARACFLIDDPNLHWPSYGYVSFRELALHAEEYGYHAAMAMVPRDARVVHPAAARLFRERNDRLSLVMHGNDHVLEEFGGKASENRHQAVLAQAMRRIAAFERRTGVPVGRVMVAPHGVCSEAAARPMRLLGLEALCISRPYPWLAQPPHSWLTRPQDSSPLAAWDPATFVAGGLPVLLRIPLSASSDRVVLGAYLGEPLVLYGHHVDLRHGLELLADRARLINGLGPVRWSSLADIAESNLATRNEGDLLRIRPFSRRVRLELPEGLARGRVELPPVHGACGDDIVVLSWEGVPGVVAAVGEEFPVRPGSCMLELRPADALNPATVPPPGWRPWPLARRLAGEGRDRITALYGRRFVKRTAAEAAPAP